MKSDVVIIPLKFFNLTRVGELSIGGRGGQERNLGSILLPSATRVSSPLFDYEIIDGQTSYLVEIKKQYNDQWFDIGKYFRLSESNRNIVIVFVNHDAGKVNTITAIRLGVLVEFLLSHSEYKRYGWSPDVLRVAHDLKKPEQCPELQFKAKLKVRNFIEDHEEMFQVIYRA
jgi:hypothetical protein